LKAREKHHSYHAFHELVKKRDGKLGVPVRGTVEHSLFNQAVAEFGQGPKVLLFARRKPVKPDSEETFIKTLN